MTTIDAATERRWHLAQLNVGRLLAPVESEMIAGFVAALEPINAIADASPGFVWRLQTDAGNATDDPPDRGRPVPHQHERVVVPRGAACLHVRHGARGDPAPAARLVRAPRDRPSRALVGARRAHPERRRSARAPRPTCASTARRPAAFTFRTPFEPEAAGPGDPDGGCGVLLAGPRRRLTRGRL